MNHGAMPAATLWFMICVRGYASLGYVSLISEGLRFVEQKKICNFAM